MNTQTQHKRLTQGVARSRAFTLVELLLVIAIIAVLSTMSLNLLASAANDAKISATQSRISQITALLQLQMEDYEVRRLPISTRTLLEYAEDKSGPNQSILLRDLRRHLLLDIINAEIPRALRNGTGQDFNYGLNSEIGTFPTTTNVSDGTPQSFKDWLDSDDGYDSTVDLGDGGKTLTVRLGESVPASVTRLKRLESEWSTTNTISNTSLPAEYLYQILSNIQIDGVSAIEMLGNAAVGDFDDDGIPEIVDAWGEPMMYDIEQVFYDGPNGDGMFVADPDRFVPLDPRQPVRLSDIRFVIGSFRVPETLPLVERTALGLE